jgi:precorrin-3B methylase
MKNDTGEVYLVGAGPGERDLLTIRALHLMQKCDVCIYDNLVSDEVIELVRRDADMIFAGKEILKLGLQECSLINIKNDGEHIKKGEKIAIFKGLASIILKKERVILNLLQRLSGIATTTKKRYYILFFDRIVCLQEQKKTNGG